MIRFRFPTMAAAALLACTGCSQDMFATHNTPQDLQNMQQGALSTKSSQTAGLHSTSSPDASMTNYASAGTDCNTRANKRLTMYDRPDTYPISDIERHDAYLALYSSCMREHNFQIAGPVHGPAGDASQLAALAPAAGGRSPYPVNTVNAGNTLVSTSSTPGATVVMIGGGRDSVSQLSSLSPSAGSPYPPNATVVLVSAQPQQPVMAQPMAAYAPPAGPLPVAVPIAPPMARSTVAAPAPQAAAAYAPPAVASNAGRYMPRQTGPALAPGESYPPRPSTPRPSLAGADDAALGANNSYSAVVESEKANRQLENVLEQ